MPLDNFKNKALFDVTNGYDAAATSVDLTADPGSAFPTVPCNGWWYNATDYPDAISDPNYEIVRVTARSGATLTVSRAQEGTSAATHNTGGKVYKLGLGPTAKTFNTDMAPPGSDGNVIFNDAGSYGADSALSYAKTSDLLTLLSDPGANAAPTAGIEKKNSTAASSGNQRHSPGDFWEFQAWKTGGTPGSQPGRFRAYAQGVQGSSAPTGNWMLGVSINGGAFADVFQVNSAGYVAVAPTGGNLTFAIGSFGGGYITGSSTAHIGFTSSSTNPLSGVDTTITRVSSAVLRVADGGSGMGDLRYGLNVQAKTTNYTAAATDSGSFFTNTGAAGQVNVTLPSTPRLGWHAEFYAVAAQKISFVAPASHTVEYNGTTSGTAGNATSTAAAAGVWMRVVYVTTNRYAITSQEGGITIT